MTRNLLARIVNVVVFAFVTRDEMERAGRWVWRTAPVQAMTRAEARGYRKGYHAAADDMRLAEPQTHVHGESCPGNCGEPW